MADLGSLDIQLLGSFRVSVDGRRVEESAWARKKSKTLIKLLALAPRHEMHRDQLIELLWPEVDPQQGQNNLHKVIHAARRALEPDLKEGPQSRFLATQEQRVTLRAAGTLRIDLIEFEQAATAGLAKGDASQFEEALGLYGGELLPEDRYEDWAAVRRERIRQLHHEVLAALAELTADPSRAIELWQQTLAADRCNETAHRALMRLYAKAGKRHLAVAQFRNCQEALREDLQADVESATQRLHEEILGDRGEETESGRGLEPAPAAATTGPGATNPSRGRWLPLAAAAAAVLAGAGWMLLHDHPRTIRALAVLPFTASPSQLEYLSDGITESIIGGLSALPEVRVMARSTMFTYKGVAADPRKAGRELKVDAVVIGSVSQTGEAVQVSAELVDVEDGARIWGQQYRLDPRQLAGAQSSISTEVASALRLKLSRRLQQRLAQPGTTDPGAYRNYLLGRFHWNQRTREGFEKSIGFFEQAVAQDPLFAAAYTGLADAYGLMGFSQGKPRDFFPKAQAMVKKALEIDPESADAHTSLAMIRALYEWNWTGAESAFRRAIELNAGHATAHHWYGVHLSAMGRFDEAQGELGRALELDPLSRIILTNSAYPIHYTRRFGEAIRMYRRVLEMDPGFVVARQDLTEALAESGDEQAALAELRELLRLVRHGEAIGGATTYREAVAGYRTHLTGRLASEYISPVTLAKLSIGLGDSSGALEWLERALEEHSGQLVYLRVDPVYDPLRRDPRFEGLLRRIGL